MESLGYLAAILMGMTLGVMGGGGSILTVPILVYLFHLNPSIATGYSLFVVGLTSLIGGISYLKRGEVDLKTAAFFAFPGFLGVALSRRLILPLLPDPIFQFGGQAFTKAMFIMAIFGLLMLLASISMIRERKQRTLSTEHKTFEKLAFLIAQGFFVGMVTGFVGAGGGFLIIPALVLLVGLPMRQSVGTSLLIIASNALVGFVSDLLHPNHSIDWFLLVSIAGLAIAGLATGMLVAKNLPDKLLKKAFGYFVLAMGFFILYDQLHHL